MWIFYAIGSSFFAGITAILAKCGIKKTDSDVATAIRTVVVLLFSWLMVLITGTWGGMTQIHGRTLLFLVLSGLATGASWLCYFHALQKGDINKVVPIDKSSTVLSILLALIFLCEGITGAKIVSVAYGLNQGLVDPEDEVYVTNHLLELFQLTEHEGTAKEVRSEREENLHAIVQKEIGFVFAKVLECAGVYKRTPEGQAAFKKFLECI